MNKVIPTVFAKDKESFNERLKVVSKIAKLVQIDFMDGKFVKNNSVGLDDIQINSKKNKYEAHLMCFAPESYFFKLKKKGFSKVLFHYEAVKDAQEIVDLALDNKLEPWIAFNSSTSLKEIIKCLSELIGVKGVLFLGHKSGVEGIGFERQVLGKIKAVRARFSELNIQVDGGVNIENVSELGKSGVNFVNVGSSIDNSFNPLRNLKEIEREFNSGKK